MSADVGPPDPGAIGQIGTSIGVAVAAAVLGVWNWFKGAKDAREEKRRIVFESFDIADMGPVRELAPMVREAREIVPLVKDAIKSLAELHAKRDRADLAVAAMHAEFRETLRDLDSKVDEIRVSVRVLERMAGRN